MKRAVRVCAVVMTGDGDTDEDAAAAYDAVARALQDCAARKRRGETRLLLPIEYPLVRFELDSAPLDSAPLDRAESHE
jgi:hypothetical protein